jgi:recombination protein RecA
MLKRNNPQRLSTQIRRKVQNSTQKERTKPYDGNSEAMISTGSTLLDLAISGGRKRGGGIPSGIIVEIFGPSSTGKTVLLCEIAGAIQRQGGEIMFHDPEARLNKQFARMFDLNTDGMEYHTPDRVPEVFAAVRNWTPNNAKVINGVFADSLAALSTDLEMDKDEGDRMGMRRAKEFSEELRKTCRILSQKNILMVCSNQIRQNVDVGSFAEKYSSPGGESVKFYSSLRLRTGLAYPGSKIIEKRTISGKEVKRTVGIRTEILIYKSTVWKPAHTAPLTILFDYGIDDIRENLQFVKNYTKNTIYQVNDKKLSNGMQESITIVEEDNLEDELKDQVIDLWEEIEEKFDSNRKRKQR